LWLGYVQFSQGVAFALSLGTAEITKCFFFKGLEKVGGPPCKKTHVLPFFLNKTLKTFSGTGVGPLVFRLFLTVFFFFWVGGWGFWEGTRWVGVGGPPFPSWQLLAFNPKKPLVGRNQVSKNPGWQFKTPPKLGEPFFFHFRFFLFFFSLGDAFLFPCET